MPTMLLCRFEPRLGLESFGLWHFLKLVIRGFLPVLRFPPVFHRFNGTASKIKLKINAISTLSNLTAELSLCTHVAHGMLHVITLDVLHVITLDVLHVITLDVLHVITLDVLHVITLDVLHVITLDVLHVITLDVLHVITLDVLHVITLDVLHAICT